MERGSKTGRVPYLALKSALYLQMRPLACEVERPLVKLLCPWSQLRSFQALRVGRHVARIAACLPGHPWRGREAAVYAAAVCHDIGKIAVPLAILTAPRPLTETERAIVREHPTYGLALLLGYPAADANPLLAQAVGGHHERWDGAGYPTGLSGEAIAPLARLVGLCDAYDAMRTERPYSTALGHAAALGELRRGAGGQFDPDLTAYVLDHDLLDEDRAANP